MDKTQSSSSRLIIRDMSVHLWHVDSFIGSNNYIKEHIPSQITVNSSMKFEIFGWVIIVKECGSRLRLQCEERVCFLGAYIRDKTVQTSSEALTVWMPSQFGYLTPFGFKFSAYGGIKVLLWFEILGLRTQYCSSVIRPQFSIITRMQRWCSVQIRWCCSVQRWCSVEGLCDGICITMLYDDKDNATRCFMVQSRRMTVAWSRRGNLGQGFCHGLCTHQVKNL